MDLETLSDSVNECQISQQSEAPEEIPSETILDLDYKQNIQKWPRLKLTKIPAIFLHKPAEFDEHVQRTLSMRIKFYQPTLGQNFTKISCVSHNDHKSLVKYFEKKQLPYHTYGNPAKRKMKVVIRGLPRDTVLDKVKAELKSLAVPLIRVHKMKTKDDDTNPTMLMLAVVPYDQKGVTLLSLRKLMGHDVTVEPPNPKINQCYRCQKWGHTERYCHGEMKCVKCAGDHNYKKCTRNDETTDPPKCANCGGDHTANYKKCPRSPFSVRYELSQITKHYLGTFKGHKKPIIVTQENCDALYNIKEYDSE